ncbi:MAG: ABC transporter permease subunit [Alphaproteobacteria bacterium]|nr:ABC transporter permease subunit [Alphaproteobacteria bacterium]MBF0249423.1 ABC transporter permease subunit [Alphaproteobacteria bacterium]
MKKPLSTIGGRLGRIGVLLIPAFWMSLFFVLPFFILVKISISEVRVGVPPYTEIFEWVGGLAFHIKGSLANYSFLISDTLYLDAYLNSIKIAALSTLICLLIGYPMALGISRTVGRTRNFLLVLVILPFWTSFLIRVYAWIGLLKNEGLINAVLQWAGIIDQPLELLHTPFAVYLGITYSYLPFMVLPLYATLERMDHALLEAAADLGARPARAFLSITLPQSFPGIVAGSMLVFIPAIGEFVIPDLLGGPSTLMIGKVLWNEFFLNRDWPLASAVAVVMLVLLIAPLVWWQRHQQIMEEKQG